MPRFYQLHDPRVKVPLRARVAPARQAPQRLGGPLSNQQKAALCILCREAYDLQPDASPDPTEAQLAEYRHAQVEKATGKPGLTACVQDDWKPLRAHFLALVGRTGEAFKAAMEHGTEDVKVAMFKLRQACQRAGLPLAYPAAICRNQYRCALEDATAKQLWQLVFTVNNRGTARRRAR